jgi:hypothetical protein
MSTVHEVVAARHCGIKIVAFSLITNICEIDEGDDDNEDEDDDEVSDDAANGVDVERPGVNVIKLFSSSLMKVENNLASYSTLVLYLRVRLQACLRGERRKGSPCLNHKY